MTEVFDRLIDLGIFVELALLLDPILSAIEVEKREIIYLYIRGLNYRHIGAMTGYSHVYCYKFVKQFFKKARKQLTEKGIYREDIPRLCN